MQGNDLPVTRREPCLQLRIWRWLVPRPKILKSCNQGVADVEIFDRSRQCILAGMHGALGYGLNLLFLLIERRFVHWSGK
jgi:hypothetical protein